MMTLQQNWNVLSIPLMMMGLSAILWVIVFLKFDKKKYLELNLELRLLGVLAFLIWCIAYLDQVNKLTGG